MTGRYASIATEDGNFDAYVSEPVAADAPAVVVLQEIFGLTPFVTAACNWLSDHGYIAIAPDLFWRQRPGVVLRETQRDEAASLMKGMDEDLALEDAWSALEYGKSLPMCNGNTAAVGYCLGGKLAVLMAARTEIDAAVSYYGVGIHNILDEASRITVPILLHFGADDHLCPPSAQESIASAMRRAPCSETIEVHPGVGHAFAREGGTAFDEVATSHANATTLLFLGRALGARSGGAPEVEASARG